MNSQPESRIEYYLDELCAQLVNLPDEKRGEVRRELRNHIETSLATQQIAGKTTDEAIEAALNQLGDDPVRIGRDIASTWQRNPTQVAQSLRQFVVAGAGTPLRVQGDALLSGKRRLLGFFGSAVWMLGVFTFLDLTGRVRGPYPLTPPKILLLWGFGLLLAAVEYFIMEYYFPRHLPRTDSPGLAEDEGKHSYVRMFLITSPIYVIALSLAPFVNLPDRGNSCKVVFDNLIRGELYARTRTTAPGALAPQNPAGSCRRAT